MGDWGLYIALLVPTLLLGLGVQWWLKRTFEQYSHVDLMSGMTGAEVARQILDRNGLEEVPVDRSNAGALSDNYDPRKRALHLSPPVYDPKTVAAAAVAAHESGHALQHSSGYAALRLRSAMFPVVAIASQTWIWLLVLGLILNAFNLVAIAILIYAVAVLFHIVTLPVEFNASKRAGVQLRTLGLVTTDESAGVQKVLRAAALTYVAGALAALTQLLYFVLAYLRD
jgi:Zn-dependent membrane protease YugP